MGSTTKRIVFPLSFPVIEKTIRLDTDLTGLQAVAFIGEKSRCVVFFVFGLPRDLGRLAVMCFHVRGLWFG